MFLAIKGRLSTAGQDAVDRWRRESPDNERLYHELECILAATEVGADHLDTIPPSPLKLVHEAESLHSTGARVSSRGRWRRNWLTWGGWAAAAALVVAFALGSVTGGPDAGGPALEEFATGSTEAATLTLQDGTVVRLGPDSRLRITSRKDRDVTLWGRALFSVAKASGEPFRVQTENGVVEVLGTRFGLESLSDEMQVTVMEGRVAISASGQRTEVPAGERRRVVRGAMMPAERISSDETLTDWAGQFLVFRNTPLRDAAAEISALYRVRIDIRDSGLARQTITATFSNQTLDQVMVIFCIIAQAHCTTTEDGSVRVEPKSLR